jgi:hypothetical protein
MITQPQIDPHDRPNSQGRRCTATCDDGSPCRAWAVRGSEPPRCAPHGGGRAPTGAPPGNQNARTHGFYAANPGPAPPPGACTIDDVIADLHGKRRRLSRYIDEHIDDLAPADLVRFLRIHAQSCSRLGRLLRDREALTGGWSAGMDSIVEQALAELGEEWGADLT